MRAETKAYSLIALLLALIVVSLSVVIISQPAEAREIEPEWTWRVYPTDRTNTGALLRMKMDAIEQRVSEIIEQYEAEQAEQAVWEEQQAAYYEPNEFVYYDGAYYNTSTFDASAYPTDGLTPQSGVNAYNGRVETYYSSNVLYHYNTAAWTVDDEGFYRTDEGYYVVAASDMPQGAVFEGSKGDCIVLDSGCADGVTDYYVQW